LVYPAPFTIPIYASAVSQKMTALCGEIADGIILTRSTLATAAVVREQLAEGARRAGRDLDQIIVTTLLPAAVGQTRREALDALRPGLAFYAGFFPRYNRMMAEHGFVEEAAAIAAAWSRGDRHAAERAVSDELIDATSIAGTPEQCRERVEAYRRSGIDVPILSPFARGARAKAKFVGCERSRPGKCGSAAHIPDISSPPCLPRLLSAGGFAGWASPHWKSAALSRRTWEAVIRRAQTEGGVIEFVADRNGLKSATLVGTSTPGLGRSRCAGLAHTPRRNPAPQGTQL